MSKKITYSDLSTEQQEMIQYALDGKNILVDACIGSGKTTTIQCLCDKLSKNKKILYLTYNKLLKIDAKDKIKNKNVMVQNYHGFAWYILNKQNIHVSQGDLISTVLTVKPPVPKYDVLIIDEYQDIYQELADMLLYIKSKNPKIQIIAVGDMEQKIYDYSVLDVFRFMQSFLGEHERVAFTKCFRINSDFGSMLGRVWQKPINGVNTHCRIREMNQSQVVKFLSKQKLKDVLCLGSRTGAMSKVLNELEEKYPEKFNKRTVYASIRDEGSEYAAPDGNTAIFTTYDGSKGLERDICVIFDYNYAYWSTRLRFADSQYEVIRNIFCVAASRGKKEIVFVKNQDDILTEAELSTNPKMNGSYSLPFYASDMFSYKYREDVDKCFSMLNVSPINVSNQSEINIENHDELIDLSPCIGNYQELVFFKKYNIENQIAYMKEIHKDFAMGEQLGPDASIQEYVLYLTSLETKYNRYYKQVSPDFISEMQTEMIKDRLGTVFTGHEDVQKDCSIRYLDKKGKDILRIDGRIDVFKNGYIYELKFVDELSHEHFLQLATYLIAMGIDKGILWNTKKNQMYEVSVPDKEKFLIQVLRTITKGSVNDCQKIICESSLTGPCKQKEEEIPAKDKKNKKKKSKKKNKKKAKREE